MTSRESGRIKDADKKRILDEASRKRRARKALEALEQDNFHEDPHADLVMSKKVPKFHDNLDQTNNSGGAGGSGGGGANGAGGSGGGVSGIGGSSSNRNRKLKRKHNDYMKAKYRKNFIQLLEEDKQYQPDMPNYCSAQVSSSAFPDRHFCAVCGFPSNYTCTSCGTRYCCIRCLGTHQDTRCLKWTA